MRKTIAGALLAGALLSCGPPERQLSPRGALSAPSQAASVAPAPREVVVSLVGTNDLHGRVFSLPLLGGYVENLRAARQRDGGGVLLVDAGDMFQGTLESNLLEGKPVRDAYRALGYAAVAVGNHEFDFGPVGPAPTPRAPGDDPRGALKALALEAPFPFLLANVHERSTGKRVDYPNMPSSVAVNVAGVRIGIIGVTTEDTLTTTISSNVKDLAMAPVAETIVKESAALRAAGARAVVVLAHAGGKCHTFTNDLKADKCEVDAEIFRVARALPKGTVDAIVAGHTHAGVAHEVQGIPIIEQYSYGRSFGRVDLKFVGEPPVLAGHQLHAPRQLCPADDKPDFSTCEPGSYEGAVVTRSAEVARAIDSGVVAAKDKRASIVGPTVTATIHRSYQTESALGNLFADLIRTGTPGADIALMNGGGLREDLPAGQLSYGALFEAFPFDNQIATVTIKVADLEQIVAAHIGHAGGGVLSFSGAHVHARCDGKRVDVQLERSTKGKAWKDDDTIVLAASDFMLLGGDSFWGDVKPVPITVADALVRDVLESGLKGMKSLAPGELFDAKRRRLALPTPRPVRCD
jgi:2',3'-cyclic-nucleotide 2'-phosphodiesterase (5'-nucleotidase family)